jgi:RES domain
MAETVDIRKALAIAPVSSLEGEWVRCVAVQPLAAAGPPNYLFTSGKPNRFNTAGVHCVYFSEDERTAREEYARRLAGQAARQPVAIYVARVKLAQVLDLANPNTCQALGLGAKHLSAAWIRARQALRTQLLGLAVSQQHVISAIRFPSDAARASGFAGFNVVIFRDAVRRPDFVKILGPTSKPLQQWP